MASKPRRLGALSNGTLALKFMQRIPDGASEKVTLKQAKVKDEGEWEIDKEVREGWGGSAESLQNVEYEQSYLPFLLPAFATSSEPPAPGGGGRRSFGRFNKALEKHEPGEITDDMLEKPPSATGGTTSSPAKSKSSKASVVTFRKPKGISDVLARRPPPASPDPAIPKPAQQSLSISSGKSHPPQPVFQRPAGVDTPVPKQKRKRRPEGEVDAREKDDDDDVGPRRVKKRKDKAPVEMIS